jgi:hypothetical protein
MTATRSGGSCATAALRSRIACVNQPPEEQPPRRPRCDRTADSFLGFAALSSIRLWIGFVHAT